MNLSNEFMSPEQFAWLRWCLMESKGNDLEGRPIMSFEEVMAYTTQMSDSGQDPPPVSNSQTGDAISIGACMALMISGSEKTLDLTSEVVAGIWLFLGHLISNTLYRWGETFVEPLIHYLPSLSERDQWLLVYVLSSIAREQQGSRKSLALLRRVDHFVDRMEPSSQTNYYHSLGNCLKDMGEYNKALENYRKAEKLAHTGAPELLGAIYMQLGRFYIEQGDQPELAEEYFKKAAEIGFDAVDSSGSNELLVKINQVQVLLKKGDYLQAIKDSENIFSMLPEQPLFHEEAVLQQNVLSLAQIAGLGIHGEWAVRMSVVATRLSGRLRELSAIYGNLAHALSHLTQGAEFRYWSAKALRLINSTAVEMNRAPVLGTLGFAMYAFGLIDESIKRYQQSIDVARTQGSKETLVNSLAQLSLVASARAPEQSRAAADELAAILQDKSLFGTVARQEVFTVARDMLQHSPDVLEEWPEQLRTGKTRFSGRLESLQRVLDVHGERDLPSNKMLPAPTLWKRGRFFAHICGRGFLDFFKHYCGLLPIYVMEWVLEQASSTSLRNRICLEWVVNPGGMRQENRRASAKDDMHSWQQELPKLRAMMMRFFFQEDLGELSSEELKRYPLPQNVDEAETARREMAVFYNRWRKKMVVQTEDLLDSEHRNARARNPSREIPKDMMKDYMEYVAKNPSLAMAMMQAYNSAKGPEDIQAKLKEILPEAMWEKLSSIPTSQELGVRLDNFLETELCDPMKEFLGVDSGKQPIVVEVFQAETRLWWIFVDLSPVAAKDMIAGVDVTPVAIERTKADEMVTQIGDILKAQEQGEWRNPGNLYLEAPEIFLPLVEKIPESRPIWLNLMPPWSTIPFEQLPLHGDGSSLIDRHRVLRRDRFNRWLQPSKSTDLEERRAVVFGDPLGDLSQARQEALQVAQVMNVAPHLGPECTRECIRVLMPGSRLIHIACHGFIFRQLGDFQALDMADGYLLGQDLATLDLTSCRLAVLSACNSGSGDAYGTSPVESLAEYLIEAGADAVLASKSVVSDEKTARAMEVFYASLKNGDFISEAASKAFGKKQRLENGILVYPWVLIGRDCRVFEGRIYD